MKSCRSLFSRPLWVIPLLLAAGAAAQESTPEQVPAPADEAAVFESAVQEALPVSPEEIRELRRRADEVSRAAAAPPGPPPQPVTSSVPVSLAPGAAIPQLRLGHNMVSSLCFLDATGAPWPVERWAVSATAGDANRFKVSQLDNHVLTLSSGSHYAIGNLAVKLVELPTPVMVTLVQGQNKTVDYNKELHIGRVGPLGQRSVETNRLPEASPALIDFLDNIPPEQAQEKTVNGLKNARVWLYGKRMIVRTRSNLLSPAWLEHTQAGDGTRVYAIDPTPVLLFSTDGRLHQVTVEL